MQAVNDCTATTAQSASRVDAATEASAENWDACYFNAGVGNLWHECQKWLGQSVCVAAWDNGRYGREEKAEQPDGAGSRKQGSRSGRACGAETRVL